MGSLPTILAADRVCGAMGSLPTILAADRVCDQTQQPTA